MLVQIIICFVAFYLNVRLMILRKKPTWLKLGAAGAVLIGVAVSIIPVLAGMDEKSKQGNEKWESQPTAARILWPLCFMLGFVSSVILYTCRTTCICTCN